MFSFSNLVKSWDDFFFEPRSTKGIGLFRVFWGLLLLFYFLFDAGNIDLYYGKKAILSLPSALGEFQYPHLNLFQFIGVENKIIYSFMAIYLIAILLFVIGLYTKVSLLVLFVCMVSLHQRNIWLLSSCDLLIRLVTFYMVFTPCENSFSIDQLRLKIKETSPLWGLRLIQIQVSVVYLWTVWQKLKGDSWVDGDAVYYATRLEAFKNIEIPWLLDSMLNLKLMSWGTILIEFALGAFVWFREFKKFIVFSGIFFHLCIELIMSIPFFEIVMIVLLLTFVLDEIVFVWIKLFRAKAVPQISM